MTKKPEKKTSPAGLSEARAKFEHAAGATSTEATDVDAQLEKLAAENRAACEAVDRALDARDKTKTKATYDAAEAVLRQSQEEERQTLVRMFRINADGLRGIRAKVRAMLAEWSWDRLTGPDMSDFDPCIDGDMLRSVVVDLERLAGENATETRQGEDVEPAGHARTGRTAIQRLYRQAVGAHEHTERCSDSEGYSSWQKYDALRTQIMRTPATCPRDVAVKLRLYAAVNVVEHPETLPEAGDNDHGWLRTAICELERLGSGDATDAPAKPIPASTDLEAIREVQKAWCDLSFTREEDGEIADYWALPEIRGVSENDAYAAQCHLGALYAFEMFDLIETFKEGALSLIAQAVVERGQWTGFEVGFFSAVDEYITDGQINIAGGVLARTEEASTLGMRA